MMLEGQRFERFDGFRSPMRGNRDFRHPATSRYGFSPLRIVGGFVHALLLLGFLALGGFLAYQKGKKDGMALQSVTANPVTESETKNK